LAISLDSAGNDVLPLLEGLLSDQVRVLGPDDLSTINTESFMASTLVQTGRAEEGIEHARMAMEGYAKNLGPEHEMSLDAHETWAWCLEAAGRTDEARGAYEALIDDCRRILGEDHELTKANVERYEELYPPSGENS
jgi:hypothetical protein